VGEDLATAAPAILERVRAQVEPVLRAAVAGIPDAHMQLIARYQLGWCDAAGEPVTGGGGKAVRPALAVLAAQAAGGSLDGALAAGAAVELVHNFSLLHDDIMDGDTERRHRPTGWVVFGQGQAILAGNAMLTAAVQALARSGGRALDRLLEAVQQLISGQSADLLLEGRSGVELDDVLRMEGGKTAALLSAATALGPLAGGVAEATVAELAAFGYELGMAFQIVDDILGVTGDPAVTGKSASSDVRAGKNSVPIVVALRAGRPQSERLAALFAGGPPESDDDVALATKLIDEAGGLSVAAQRADGHLAAALAHLHGLELPGHTEAAELEILARYIVARDR
jgi:geranylgeranyl diphosphate synthase type I